MNIKKYISIILFLYLMCFPNDISFGQNPDTSNYFPHHLGDVWEYYYFDYLSPSFDTLQSIIVFDSTDTIGNSYVIQESYYINPYKRAGNPYYFIDTCGDVYETTSLFQYIRKIFKHEAQPGDWWIMVDTLGTLEIAKLKSESTEYLFGIQTTVRKIDYYLGVDTTDTTNWWNLWSEKYAQNFGLVWRGEGETFSDLIIKGCLINGILYGDTTFVTFIDLENEHQIPSIIQLNQNYPNPFNSQTNISFKLKKPDYISLIIYNMLGQEIIRLIDNRFYGSGEYDFAWKGRDSHGRVVGSGVYIYTLNAGANKKSRKMILIK